MIFFCQEKELVISMQKSKIGEMGTVKKVFTLHGALKKTLVLHILHNDNK